MVWHLSHGHWTLLECAQLLGHSILIVSTELYRILHTQTCSLSFISLCTQNIYRLSQPRRTHKPKMTAAATKPDAEPIKTRRSVLGACTSTGHTLRTECTACRYLHDLRPYLMPHIAISMENLADLSVRSPACCVCAVCALTGLVRPVPLAASQRLWPQLIAQRGSAGTDHSAAEAKTHTWHS